MKEKFETRSVTQCIDDCESLIGMFAEALDAQEKRITSLEAEVAGRDSSLGKTLKEGLTPLPYASMTGHMKTSPKEPTYEPPRYVPVRRGNGVYAMKQTARHTSGTDKERRNGWSKR